MDQDFDACKRRGGRGQAGKVILESVTYKEQKYFGPDDSMTLGFICIKLHDDSTFTKLQNPSQYH